MVLMAALLVDIRAEVELASPRSVTSASSTEPKEPRPTNVLDGWCAMRTRCCVSISTHSAHQDQDQNGAEIAGHAPLTVGCGDVSSRDHACGVVLAFILDLNDVAHGRAELCKIEVVRQHPALALTAPPPHTPH